MADVRQFALNRLVIDSLIFNGYTGQSERNYFFEDVTHTFADALHGCDIKTRQAFAQLQQLSLTQKGQRGSLCIDLFR